MKKRITQGFTLIELLVVLFIVAIFAAIALPAYNNFVIRNAESEAKARLGNIQSQAEKWRFKALSYRGFVPSVTDTQRYSINIVDGLTKQALTNASSTGGSWIAIATPSNGLKAEKFLMFSNGTQCKVASTTSLNINDNCTGKEKW